MPDAACPQCGSSPGGAVYKPPEPIVVFVCSILATVLCCMPFGVVGIVYSALAMARHGSGDYVTSDRYAGNAKTWNWVAFGVGLVVTVIWTAPIVLGALGVIGGAAGSRSVP